MKLAEKKMEKWGQGVRYNPIARKAAEGTTSGGWLLLTERTAAYGGGGYKMGDWVKLKKKKKRV